jgi:hypothetical protein
MYKGSYIITITYDVIYCLSKIIKIYMYRNIILSVVLYGCKTRSITFREVHKLRVFENRVLRRIIVPKRGELTGE